MSYSQYLSDSLNLQTPQKIVETRVGSDSDFPRILELLKGLNKEQVAYLLTIKSAYRTPQAMIDSARAFPEVLMSSNDPTVSDQTTHEMLKVKFCIAIAGWSAHIAGMTASETSTPVIALPAESSAGGIVDSTLSMLNMTPGRPNGFVATHEHAISVVQKMYNLELDSNFNSVVIPNELMEHVDENLLNTLGIQVGNSPIGIALQDLSAGHEAEHGLDLPVIIPTLPEQLNWDNVGGYMRNLSYEGMYMGTNLAAEPKTQNALIYIAKLIGMFNPDVKENLEQNGESLRNPVLKKDRNLLSDQLT